jgi:hypothetical protein
MTQNAADGHDTDAPLIKASVESGGASLIFQVHALLTKVPTSMRFWLASVCPATTQDVADRQEIPPKEKLAGAPGDAVAMAFVAVQLVLEGLPCATTP